MLLSTPFALHHYNYTLQMNLNGPNERLEDLSREQLVALLRSTHEFRTFTDYYDQHQLVFLQKVASVRDPPPSNPSTEQTIINELELFNEQEGTGLHKYHLDLIFNTFKNYYQSHEQEQSRLLTHRYQSQIAKAEREGDRSLPIGLEEQCMQKEKLLAKQVRNKRNKTLKM